LSSNGNNSVIDYNITSFGSNTIVRAIANKNTIVLEIHTHNNDATYLLMNKERSMHSNVYDGMAVFENIEKGVYVLSENMKHFCVIEIQ